MTACGVNVPLSYYPRVLEWIVHFLPLTNGLLAILGHIAAVGLGWMTLAMLSFDRLASRGRLDGSLDYGA